MDMNKLDIIFLLVCGAFLGVAGWNVIKFFMEERKRKQAEMIREIIREGMDKHRWG